MQYNIVYKKGGCGSRVVATVEGEEIHLPGIPGFRFFIHLEYGRKRKHIAVSEFQTGATVACKRRRSAAIKRAIQNINREGINNFAKMVDTEVSLTGRVANF